MKRTRLRVLSDQEAIERVLDEHIRKWGFEDKRTIKLCKYSENHGLEEVIEFADKL